MKKSELIARIKYYITSRGYNTSHTYYGIRRHLTNGLTIEGVSFSDIPEFRDKMFFECTDNEGNHSQPWASDMQTEVLVDIVDTYRMPFAVDWYKTEMWNAQPQVEWDKLSWGGQNMYLEVMNTERIYQKAMEFCTRLLKNGRTLDTINYSDKWYLNGLFIMIFGQLRIESSPEHPECLFNESIENLMAGIKEALRSIIDNNDMNVL